MNAYRELVAASISSIETRGIAQRDMPVQMRAHQIAATSFALERGRAALFLDTGLGKSLCSFTWAANVSAETGKPVLMLAPLGVVGQHAREAALFGFEATICRSALDVRPGLNLANYDRLHLFDPSAFAGLVLDESSIIKNFSGVMTRRLMEFGAAIPFRLACTATPAPNDHMELGQHAQFLGVMSSSEMLSRWFIADQSEMGRYRLKRHAITSFWQWVASWARCAELPSDLGGDDTGYVLPALEMKRHLVRVDLRTNAGEDDGQQRLFRIPSHSATSIHAEKRITARDRSRKIADIVLGVNICGSQSTQSGVAPNIKPMPPKENGASSRAGTPNKTKPTCANITSESQTASKDRLNRISSETSRDGRDTPTTRNSESAQKSRRGHAAQIGGATPACAQPLASARLSMTISSPGKAAGVQSVAPNAPPSGASGSPLIIATRQDVSEDSSVPTATRESASSAMMLGACVPLSSTSLGNEFWVIWCETDYDQDELEALFGDLAISIKGSQSADVKERLHRDWIAGVRKILITKPSLFGFGCNWQHCARVAFVGLSFSYEAFYQAVRRCWRFGQNRPVQVHIASAETEESIWQTIVRKRGDHDQMKVRMRAAMGMAVEVRATKLDYQPTKAAVFPAWLRTEMERAA